MMILGVFISGVTIGFIIGFVYFAVMYTFYG